MGELKSTEEANIPAVCIYCFKQATSEKPLLRVAILDRNCIVGTILCCSQECYDNVVGKEIKI